MGPIERILRSHTKDLKDKYPKYWKSLTNGCRNTSLSFESSWYGKLFRSRAMDPSWIANLLLLNSKKESEGAQQLFELAAMTRGHTQQLIINHAIDESRHAFCYVSILKLCFGGEIPDNELNMLVKALPRVTTMTKLNDLNEISDADLRDQLIQINIAEIRTLINQLLLRPFLEILSPPNALNKIMRIFDSLTGDEVQHVVYTAMILENSCVVDLEAIFQKRLIDFSKITSADSGVAETYFSA